MSVLSPRSNQVNKHQIEPRIKACRLQALCCSVLGYSESNFRKAQSNNCCCNEINKFCFRNENRRRSDRLNFCRKIFSFDFIPALTFGCCAPPPPTGPATTSSASYATASTTRFKSGRLKLVETSLVEIWMLDLNYCVSREFDRDIALCNDTNFQALAKHERK